MSAESKALLGMGIDDGAKDLESAEDLERNRKRALLLQAEGSRKKGMWSCFLAPVGSILMLRVMLQLRWHDLWLLPGAALLLVTSPSRLARSRLFAGVTLG